MLFGKKSSGGVEWLLVCLGNYGQKYENTRHNIGFMAADRLVEKNDLRCNRLRFRALTEIIDFGGAKVLLMKPQTYMNLSGDSVATVVKYRNAAPADLIVVHDDIDLALGRLRIRRGGSCGGHNGVRNIIERLGSQDFTRVKIGVGKDRANVVAHVLGKFDPASRQIADAAVAAAAKAVVAVVGSGVEQAMNLFNSFDASP